MEYTERLNALNARLEQLYEEWEEAGEAVASLSGGGTED